MFDINTVKKQAKEINVQPSNAIFKELGNNNYDFLELISEFIDNSIAAKIEGELLKVELTIGVSDNPRDSYLIIKDNGHGIAEKDLARAITPAGFSGGGTLNEHGMGLKQATASLGDLKYLVTRSKGEELTSYIDKFEFGILEITQFLNNDWNNGTEICVDNLKPSIVKTKQQSYTMGIVPYLGAKYRRFLKSDNPIMSLIIKLVDADNIEENGENPLFHEWNVKPVKPNYFHPNTRDNKPIIFNKRFKGRGWEAKFTVGYAPNDLEYEELGIEVPKQYNPYYVSISKQGFDLIVHDRVINFAQLSQLGFVNVPHNSYNYVRGTIDLVKGFTTATTKNHILRDENFTELINELKVYLEDQGVLERKNDPDELPEKLLRDRLEILFKTSKIHAKKDVNIEYTIEGLAGAIDILADGEAWELKKGQADGIDIYQLFAYMDMGNITNGYLLAKSFSPGAQVAAEFINKTHGKEINTIKMEEFPILHAPNAEERKKYFK